MHILEENILEPLLRYLRYHKGLMHLKNNSLNAYTLVDLGCGPKIQFYQYAKQRGVQFKKYIGIDPLLITAARKNGLLLKKAPLTNNIPLKDESVDYIVGFAFLEHIDHPEKIIQEAVRVLKEGGKAVFTTPTPLAKRMLEFLSYKLGLISRREIEEHKTYFTKELLVSMLPKNLSVVYEHSYFELGMNNLFVIAKK